MLLDHGQCVITASGFSHDEIAITFEDLFEIESNDRLVVGNDYALIHFHPSGSTRVVVRHAEPPTLALRRDDASSRRWRPPRGEPDLRTPWTAGGSRTPAPGSEHRRGRRSTRRPVLRGRPNSRGPGPTGVEGPRDGV